MPIPKNPNRNLIEDTFFVDNGLSNGPEPSEEGIPEHPKPAVIFMANSSQGILEEMPTNQGIPPTPSSSPPKKRKQNYLLPLAASLVGVTLLPTICNSNETVSQQTSPITFSSYSPTIPVQATVPEENKIFSMISKKLIVYPIEGYGASSYAQVIASFPLRELIAMDRAEQLSLVRDARVTKESLPYVRAISEVMIATNSSSVKNIDLTPLGFKDPKKNKLTGSSLFLSTAFIPSIFHYEANSPETIEDDTLSVICLVPGAGLSSYVLAATSNGWLPTNFAFVSALSLLDQAALVKKNMPNVTSGTFDDNRILLDLLSETIQFNSSVFNGIDTSDLGLSNPKKNILRIYDQIEVPLHYPIEEVLAAEHSFRESLLPLERLVCKYLDISRFDSMDYFLETPKMLRDVSLQIAASYNKAQRKKSISDLSNLTKDERLEVALSLYKNTNDRHNIQTYMTVNDILDLVNYNSGENISQKDLLSSTTYRRSKVQHSTVENRRTQILEDYMSANSPLNKANFVRAAAEKYDVSESTIYRDLRTLEQTAIDPRYSF